jgi:hypothetical protein
VADELRREQQDAVATEVDHLPHEHGAAVIATNLAGALCREHYESVGLGAAYVNGLFR